MTTSLRLITKMLSYTVIPGNWGVSNKETTWEILIISIAKEVNYHTEFCILPQNHNLQWSSDINYDKTYYRVLRRRPGMRNVHCHIISTMNSMMDWLALNVLSSLIIVILLINPRFKDNYQR